MKIGLLTYSFVISCLLAACAKQDPFLIARAVQADLDELTALIKEAYRTNRKFPEGIGELDRSNTNMVDWHSLNSICKRNYIYAIHASGKSAVLASVGADGLAETEDDIVLFIEAEASARVNSTERSELVTRAWRASKCLKKIE